ncbi:MAG: TetR/AcrR family transcriptional regulator [Actinomycetota bacterium]|nr:TetR/AcrR family transcriptional regulator [Actinomycetota bacterium]
MPKLWSETIGAHHREVRDAIIDTTSTLALEHGALSVTMSQIAEETGIGRATLYKYFPDIETILLAWHERHVNSHLQQLTEIANRDDDIAQRLTAVLEAYALISYEQPQTDLAALLHGGDHVAHAQQHLTALIRRLLAEAARSGEVRKDLPPDELASYCLHALTAASRLPSKAAARRLAKVTMAGLRPPG